MGLTYVQGPDGKVRPRKGTANGYPHILIKDGTNENVARVDEDGLVVKSALDFSSHCGDLLVVSNIWDGIDDDAFVNLLIVPNANYNIDATFEINAEGEFYAYLCEGPTYTAPGNILPSYSTERCIPTSANASFYSCPTANITGSGTALYQELGGAGKKSPAHTDIAEWCFTSGSPYLLQVQNKSGAAMNIAVAMTLEEHICS